ncbi:MAG TPA: carbon starvation CstA family protein [Verrucomicrobiae bacterium]|nr:carbon starvation CstA family protein [Verrucomicrobiae bacterium]
MKKILSTCLWLAVGFIGIFAYLTLAAKRGEPVNSGYILVAALCSYAIGYRFYSKWIAARVLALNDRRATPCEVHEDGRDYVKTNKWIVFGHHFAAISGPGPLVGPVLAAQFGYLPGSIWILIGVVLGGAVQDFVILFASIRRDGRSLAQMVRDELNRVAGVIGVIAILSIMIILLAVLALVVVNALAESPWGVFTVSATIPIAMLMGGYLRWVRAGKVLEASVIGVTLLLAAVAGGQWISENATLREIFHLKAPALAWSVILYAFAASVLPVWLLLAPRDYLSTFMKLGTIFLLALGVLLVLPELKMPALTRFIDGSGPVVPGKLFPFCFITIACGAISGFHTLISSGITPKIITRESYARPVGYGAMCLESLVAIMAMIAACTLDPGAYLAMNIKTPGPDAAAVATATVARVNSFGPEFAITTERMTELSRSVQEESLYGRTGGAATLAVGMANLFHKALPGLGDHWLAIWYHFALMFEALFILTTLDAGTRVGRYLLQDALGHLWKPLGDVKKLPANFLASALVVGLWGYFLLAAVYDPDGGIKALWPIFGIANQLLAATALCLATTIILKMALKNPAAGPSGNSSGARSPAMALVTLAPLLWLLAVTGTASVQKIAHPDPKIGFYAAANAAVDKKAQLLSAPAGTSPEQIAERSKGLAQLSRQVFNFRLNAWVTQFFLLLVAGIFLISVVEWILLLRGKDVTLSESKPTWLPDYAVAEASPLKSIGALGLGLVLARELSGEADVDRAILRPEICLCQPAVDLLGERKPVQPSRAEAYAAVLARRYGERIDRCC